MADILIELIHGKTKQELLIGAEYGIYEKRL